MCVCHILLINYYYYTVCKIKGYKRVTKYSQTVGCKLAQSRFKRGRNGRPSCDLEYTV